MRPARQNFRTRHLPRRSPRVIAPRYHARSTRRVHTVNPTSEHDLFLNLVVSSGGW